MRARHLFLSRRAMLAGGLAAAGAACAPRDRETGGAAGPARPVSQDPSAPRQAPAPSARPAVAEPTVTLLGDSITAGLGLPADQALPRQLESALRAIGSPARVRGAGASGDTTAGGVARVDFSVQDDTDLCVVALGANDMLQGVAPQQVRDNLAAIVRRLQARRIGVLLAGMRAPPRYGAYAAEFDRIFPELAKAFGVPLYPFLLEGVALEPALNQADGIHPNAAGVRRIAAGLAPAVAAALEAADVERGGSP